MHTKYRNRTVSGSIAISLLLLLSACGSDGEAATTTTPADAQQTTPDVDAAGDGADSEQNAFVLAAEASCSETRLAVDEAFVEGGELTVEPQVAVGLVADHLTQLYDEITSAESGETQMIEPTETYLAAVLAASEEATAAQDTQALAEAYLAVHSEKLTAVNNAGDVLGIQACAVRFAEDA